MKQKTQNVLKIPIIILSGFYIFWTYFFYRNYFIKGGFLVSLKWIVNIFSNLRYPHNFSLGRFLTSTGYYLLLFVGLGIICMIAFGIGRKILKLLRIEGKSILESTIFALGLGFGSLSLMMFGLGILKLYYTWVIYSVLGVLSVFSFFEVKKVWKQKPRLPSPKTGPTMFTIFFWGMLGVAAVINLAGALVPAVFYDSLVFHLAVPSLYKISHGIRYIETIFTSQFPQNMQMLYTLSLLLGTHILAKLMHWIMGILVVLLVYTFGRKYFNYRVGLLAAAIFYTIPMVAMQSRVTGVDLCLTFYEFLAVFALVNWFVINGRDEKQKRARGSWLITAGIFSGLAMGTKYTAMYGFLLFAISIFLITIIVHKEKIKISFKKTFLFCAVATALFSPWLIKNTVYTNNPFHPFLSSMFKSKNFYLDSKYARIDIEVYLNRGAKKWSTYSTRNIKEWLIFPWTLTKKGNDSNSFVGPIFLYLLPLLFFLRKESLIKFLIFLGVAWFFAWSLLATRNLRYFISGLTLFGIIISYLLIKVEKENRYFTKILIFLVFLMLINNIGWSLIILTKNKDPWGVVLGRESREEYLYRDSIGFNLMPYYFPVVKYINENLPLDAKVLFIGEARGYYCEREFVTSLAEDPYSIVIRLVRSCKDTDELLERLKNLGITHVLYNRREGYRLKGYKIFDWQDEDFPIFHKFWRNNLKLICAEKDVYLFEVRYEGNERINYVEIYETPEMEGYIMEARNRIARNKVDQAFNLLQKANKIMPDSAVVHFNLGFVYMKKGNLEQAIKECKYSLVLNPYDGDAALLLGYLYFRKRDLNNAWENFKKVIELKPDSAEGHGNLGLVYAEMKKYKEAIEELKIAVKLAPKNENFRNLLTNLQEIYSVEERRR
ncbi:MAG TPA: tetratricopeptide repeat protein [bacterium]|nr:tetratricopeptide repeat protein [bacterium]